MGDPLHVPQQRMLNESMARADALTLVGVATNGQEQPFIVILVVAWDSPSGRGRLVETKGGIPVLKQTVCVDGVEKVGRDENDLCAINPIVDHPPEVPLPHLNRQPNENPSWRYGGILGEVFVLKAEHIH